MEIPIMLGSCPKICNVSTKEEENTARMAAYPATVLFAVINKENL